MFSLYRDCSNVYLRARSEIVGDRLTAKDRRVTTTSRIWQKRGGLWTQRARRFRWIEIGRTASLCKTFLPTYVKIAMSCEARFHLSLITYFRTLPISHISSFENTLVVNHEPMVEKKSLRASARTFGDFLLFKRKRN